MNWSGIVDSTYTVKQCSGVSALAISWFSLVWLFGVSWFGLVWLFGVSWFGSIQHCLVDFTSTAQFDICVEQCEIDYDSCNWQMVYSFISFGLVSFDLGIFGTVQLISPALHSGVSALGNAR